MKTLIFHCDICGKEFPPQEYAFVNGQIIKIDAELKPHAVQFEGHYCGVCGKLILEYINKLSNAEHNNTNPVAESAK